MASYNYIEVSDLTDNLVGNSDMSSYIELANNAIEALAYYMRVDEDQIETNPLDFTVKRYGIAYAMKFYLLDKSGTNNNDLPANIEKYRVKYDLYNKMVEDYEEKITWQMLVGDVDYRRDAAKVSKLYNG